MEPTEQQLIDIADRMLEQLEKEYWEAQGSPQVESPEDEQPEGYQALGGDDENEEEVEDQDALEGENDEVVAPSAPTNEAAALPDDTEDIGELMEVFPTQQWVPEEKQVSINSEKIKQLSLQMNLPMPAWLQDEQLLRNRITELFGGRPSPNPKSK